MSTREQLLTFLRVPHEPAPPAGDEHVRVFRADRNYLRYRFAQWLLRNVAAAVGLSFAVMFSGNIAENIASASAANIDMGGISINTWIYLVEAGAVLAFIAQAVGSLMLLKLDFEQRWYILTDRSLRIREGILRLQEKTMTFANVQNVSVKQGPLQRLLGIADIQVRSAGGGGAGAEGSEVHEELHVAYFRGVTDAEGIREAIADRLRTFRDSGLGDPDDQPAREPGTMLIECARELHAEARQLRLALAAK